jgi:hypothetical protein
MAQIRLDGLDAVDAMFKDIGQIPFDVTAEALDAMANVAEKKVRASGEAMGVRDPESSVHILDKITHTKPKKTDSGGYSDVTFSGTRTRGRTRTRNAEIAFINEYGKRNQPARPFIRTEAETGGDQIAEPGEKIVGDWFEKAARG